MLDSKGFDLWADGYDRAVGRSEESDAYPFAGYKAVLGHIFQTVMRTPHARVLDLGFGTAVLTSKLYENGCEIFGQDFSKNMTAIASSKMPGAHLYTGDFSKGLVPKLRSERFTHIISTYALHHLTDDQKRSLIDLLRAQLCPGGTILIGDVAFASRADLAACRASAGEEWDDEEFYFVFEDWKRLIPTAVFTPLSHCAGVLEIR